MATLAELLYQSVDGSFAIDSRQRIIYWDKGCEELLGFSEHWALGRPCCDVLNGCHPVSGRALCQNNCQVAQLPEQNAPKSFLLKVRDNNGEFINLTVNIVLVPSACTQGWHALHLLHRYQAGDVLGLLDQRTEDSRKHKHSSTPLPSPEHASRLTPRETEVLGLMAEGISSRLISQRLHISHATVRNHIQHIQKKLHVHSKTEAVAYAYRHHFI